MSLISASFFVGDLNIPNTSETNTVNKVNYFITKYEPQCLDLILGVSLYEAVKTESSTRIDSLKNGALYYNDNGIKCRWNGLVHDGNLSLIANYVWLKYIEATTTRVTGKTSASKMKTEGGETVSPAEMYVKVSREFSKEVTSLCNFLWSNRLDYSEVSSCDIAKTLRLTAPINMLGI